jgi:MFS family permease
MTVFFKELHEAQKLNQKVTKNLIVHHRFQFTLLAIFGLLVAGDGMEMVVISLLYPTLRAQWGLSSTQDGMLASAVFAGLLLGNLLGGHLGDHAGRRFTLLSAGLLFIVASAAASMAPNFVSLCCFRAIVGLAVGAKVSFLCVTAMHNCLHAKMPVVTFLQFILAVQT